MASVCKGHIWHLYWVPVIDRFHCIYFMFYKKLKDLGIFVIDRFHCIYFMFYKKLKDLDILRDYNCFPKSWRVKPRSKKRTKKSVSLFHSTFHSVFRFRLLATPVGGHFRKKSDLWERKQYYFYSPGRQ